MLRQHAALGSPRWSRALLGHLSAAFRPRKVQGVQRPPGCMSAAPQKCGAEPPAGQGPATDSGRRHVVTALVQRAYDSKVLLVQRSDAVSTYQFMWGGVSGGIEAEDVSPVRRALCEIEEEVGLDPASLSPSPFSFRPLYVDDGRHHFTVHPLLFTAGGPPPEVTLNWENVDYRWVAPADIASLDTVPRLAETWARVDVDALGQGDALRALSSDRTHGAAELADWALTALEEAAQGAGAPPDADGAPLLEALRDFGYVLASCRPSMAAVANATAAALVAAHQQLHAAAGPSPLSVRDVCAAVSQAVREERERSRTAARDLRQRVRDLLREQKVSVLLTHSLSSTILGAVREAAAEDGRHLSAIVCESRPLYEGVSLAAAWAAAGVKCTVVTDAQAGVHLKEADLVLVGADAVTQDSVVNKVGTLLVALAARERGVPLYAVADTGKMSPGSVEGFAYRGCEFLWHEEEEEKGAAEVTAGWPAGAPPAGVAVRNVYFEATPRRRLLTGLLTELGQLTEEELAAAIRGKAELYKAAFQVLEEAEPGG